MNKIIEFMSYIIGLVASFLIQEWFYVCLSLIGIGIMILVYLLKQFKHEIEKEEFDMVEPNKSHEYTALVLSLRLKQTEDTDNTNYWYRESKHVDKFHSYIIGLNNEEQEILKNGIIVDGYVYVIDTLGILHRAKQKNTAELRTHIMCEEKDKNNFLGYKM